MLNPPTRIYTNKRGLLVVDVEIVTSWLEKAATAARTEALAKASEAETFGNLAEAWKSNAEGIVATEVARG